MNPFTRFSLLVALSLLSVNLISQTFINRWAYSNGNSCSGQGNQDIKTDHNGNHIFCGTIYGDANSWPSDLDPSPTGVFPTGVNYPNDFYIVKYNPAGDFISGFTVGGPGADVCWSIAIDNGNNIIITGLFKNTVDFDPSAGTTTLVSNGGDDIFLAKYTNSGTLLWAKSFGGSANDLGYRVLTDNQDNIFLSGNFQGTMDIDPSSVTNNLISNGNTDPYVAKFDANGNLLVAVSFGDANTDGMRDIALDQGKKLYITGNFDATVDFDPHPANTFTIANFGGASDIYISKFDSLLSFEWAKSLPCNGISYPRDITIDNTGNILLGGHYRSSPLDLDPSPSTTFTTATPGANNVGFLAKYDNSGNYFWSGVFPINTIFNAEVATAVSVWSDNSGNIYSTGQFGGTVDFDLSPTSTVNVVNPSQAPCLYYAKYTSNGVFVDAKRISSGFSYHYSSHLDSQGSLLVAGDMNFGIDVDPTGSNPVPLVYNGVCQNYNGFVAKYNDCVIPTITSAASSTNNICAGITLTLSVNGTLNNATTWLWSQGSCGSASVAAGTSVAVTPTGNTTYYVKGTGGCAGKNLSCTSVSISAFPQPVIALSTADFSICPGVTFTVDASGASTYTWSNGFVGSSLQTNTSVSTNYVVSGTESTNGCVASKSIAVTVYTVGNLLIQTTTVNPHDTVCKNEQMELKGSGAVSYTWNSTNPGGITHTNNVTYVYIYNFFQVGPLVFTLTGTTAEGCKIEDTYTITVLDCILGLDDYQGLNSSIRLFPVPASDVINIDAGSAQIDKLSILNSVQQTLSTKKILGEEDLKLNISELKAGIYFVAFYKDGRLVGMRRIVKE